MKKISIAVAESQSIFRKGLVQSLKDVPEIDLLFDTENGAQLIEKLKRNQVDVAIIDCHILKLNCYQTSLILKRKYPDLKIIILSQFESLVTLLNFYKIGVNAYLMKKIKKDRLIKAISKVTECNYYFDSRTPLNIRNMIRQNNFKNSLTFNAKELVIIKLICDEKSNQEIAETLCLSKRTIEWHRRNIQLKMGVKSTIGMLKYAMKNQLYSIPVE